MGRSHFLVAMERQYAIALGWFEVTEHAAETVVGLKALIEADARVTAEKRRLKEKMERIALQIRTQCDLEWEPGHIRPIKPRRRSDRQGEISKAAYRVMKASNEPLRVREIAHLVAPQLGVDNADYLKINRLHSAIDGTLNARLKEGMVVHDGGTPKRWSVRAIDARRQAQAFAYSNSRPIL